MKKYEAFRMQYQNGLGFSDRIQQSSLNKELEFESFETFEKAKNHIEKNNATGDGKIYTYFIVDVTSRKIVGLINSQSSSFLDLRDTS